MIKYEKNGDTIEISVNNKIFIIDANDEWVLKEFTLACLSTQGYCQLERSLPTDYGVVRQRVSLHRAITLKRGIISINQMIDHKDRDITNNKKENLRVCNPGLNMANRDKRKQPELTSKFKGVCWSHRNKSKPWRAYAALRNKQLHLGYFKTPEEASQAYNKKAKELYGEFACLNEVK